MHHTVCAIVAIMIAGAAQADQRPLWEAGAGVGLIAFPDYRGSDECRTYVLPVPYFVYRGEFLKVDRESVRGRLFHSNNVELDLSLNGSVPVKSSDNRTREGMPDLDPSFEIGPSLNVTLARSADDRYKLDFRFPVRSVFATNLSHIHHVGWITQPHLNIDVAAPYGYLGWRLGLLAGPLFADRRFHDYFYGVDARFATPERPAYRAPGGYSGSQFIAALSKRFPSFWVGGFLKWDTLHGAVVADSPLVKRKEFFTGGVAISWIFAESKTLVEAKD
jgi:outer membrane scaffolding protein for murein synthesis (MipA/OmpV family)